MVHPFLAIQAFLPPVLRTAAEIYFRAAGGRASFLLVPRRHARLPSPEFTHSPSAVHGCAGRAPHAAVHGHGHARVFMEAYDVREPCTGYDDGVRSRAINPMIPFASADHIYLVTPHRVQIRRAPRC